MTDLNSLSVVGVVISTLLGTGAIGFFIRYGTRLTLLETLVETSQLLTLHPRLNRVEDAISELKLVKDKLTTLDVIASRLQTVADLVKAIVPRAEHEVRWASMDLRFRSIEDRLFEKHPTP